MNSAHASLLQWLRENEATFPRLSTRVIDGVWTVLIWRSIGNLGLGLGCRGIATSYEAACYDLLQQLKK